MMSDSARRLIMAVIVVIIVIGLVVSTVAFPGVT